MRRGIGRLRAGGSGFNPLSLFAAGEQGGWYDPSDFASMFQDSAGTTPVTATTQPVGKILDKSGRGNHLIQATTTSRPTLQQDGSGFYYLNFDGVDDGLSTVAAVDLSATNKMTLFAGITKATDAAIGMVVELSVDAQANNGTFWLIAPRTGATADIGWLSKGTSEASFTASPFAAPISKVATGVGDISGPSSILRLNGTQVGSSVAIQGPGNYSNATLYVGRRAAALLPFNGRLYGLVVRGAASSAAQIASAETYVGSKMGIAL